MAQHIQENVKESSDSKTANHFCQTDGLQPKCKTKQPPVGFNSQLTCPPSLPVHITCHTTQHLLREGARSQGGAEACKGKNNKVTIINGDYTHRHTQMRKDILEV
ncbi:hypothetical protein E3U43_008378 [Larimichthys crocea]|uniref:Uncharacterized protein n=1 Tax=Larimichthys crocea TaxID=215358 RepID=A0ACD3RUN5_LARCR|nr:hypothetical protein E3U43_008378 [Larimichthys crocea]